MFIDLVELHCVVCHVENMRKFVERLVFLALLAYFSYQVGNAWMKWMDGKIGETVSKEYAEKRLFPSLSFCFTRKDVTLNKAFPHIDSTLKQTKEDVLVNLRDNAKVKGEEYERQVTEGILDM